jgi:alpha-glucosidase (family GH31 glycosyl hydrolase)
MADFGEAFPCDGIRLHDGRAFPEPSLNLPGEALPCDGIRLHDGRAACDYHNQYPVDWATLNKEAVAEAGLADEVLSFSRAGYTTSPGASRLFWLGDQVTTWDEYDGMPSALRARRRALSGSSVTTSVTTSLRNHICNRRRALSGSVALVEVG